MTFILPLVSCEDDTVPAEAYKKYPVTITIADFIPRTEIDYTLTIIGKEAPLKDSKWESTIPMHRTGEIDIPLEYAHYTLIASKPGHLPHRQYFTREELKYYSAFRFELIPENLEGLEKWILDDGTGHVYFPSEQNKCKQYARIDLAEGYTFEYLYADKVAATRVGYPVGAYVHLEKNFAQPVPPEFEWRVNIFGNLPFRESNDYCATIDYTLSNLGKTLEDLNITCYVAITLYTPTEGSPTTFVDALGMWVGANNK